MVSNTERFICVLPWNHLYIETTGKTHPCCLYNNTGRVKDSLITREDLKILMAKGEIPESCRYCHSLECTGRRSYRNHVNDLYPDLYKKLLSGTAENIISHNEEINFLDIRLGNLCNLKCRMCSPIASQQLNEEFKEFFKKPISEYHTLELESIVELLKQHPFVDRLNLAGGEPFIHPLTDLLLEKLIMSGLAKNIHLTINSNMTVLKPETLRKFMAFKRVEVFASVDGYQELNDYIRYPSKWIQIVQNIDLCLEYAMVHVNCTVQIYNIFFLNEIYDYFHHEKNLNIVLNILSNPKHLSIQTLPEPLKLDAVEVIKALACKYPHRKEILPLIEFMYREDNSDHFNQFLKWTNYLDTKRGQQLERLHFLTLFPLSERFNLWKKSS